MSRLANDRFKIELGKRLALVRQRVGLDQNEFATAIGVSVRAYSNYERGERETPAWVITQLARVMKVDPEWVLLGGGAEPRIIGARVLDVELIKTLATLIAKNLEERKLKLVPHKFAEILTFGYQHCVDSGKIDQAMFSAMIAMAA